MAELVDEWAAQCGIDAELAHSLGAAVLTTPVDWPSQIRAAAESGATWIIDMGPGGGGAGGQIVCAGTPGDIAACSKSITGRYL